MKNLIGILVLAASVSSCGDKPQVLETSRRDSAAFTGTDKAFVNPGWKPGDKGSWESQLKARQQYGQNDYTRIH
jgi:hypothetical protein